MKRRDLHLPRSRLVHQGPNLYVESYRGLDRVERIAIHHHNGLSLSWRVIRMTHTEFGALVASWQAFKENSGAAS